MGLGSILGDASDFLFGGESDTGIKENRRENREYRRYIDEKEEVARNDLNSIIPAARESSRQAYQEAIQLLRRLPMQQNKLLANDNMSAQAALLGGAQQYQNAIMGAPVDFSAFQPYKLGQGQWDATGSNPSSASWMTEMPAFLQTPQGIPAGQEAVTQAQVAPELAQALGGSRGGFQRRLDSLKRIY